jgi:hypothetical protein
MELNKEFDLWVYIYGAIVSIGIWVFAEYAMAVSFLIGFAASLFNYRMLTNSTRNALERPVGSRQGYIVFNQLIRFGIYFVVLLGAYLLKQVDIIYAFVGMLSVKIVMFVYILLKKEGNE